jgi:hypothetical protein
MRPILLSFLALAPMLALLGTPAQALERPPMPAVGAELLTHVNGQTRVTRHRHRGYACRQPRGFYRNGFALMYTVHSYPRGVAAKFGSPRCFC